MILATFDLITSSISVSFNPFRYATNVGVVACFSFYCLSSELRTSSYIMLNSLIFMLLTSVCHFDLELSEVQNSVNQPPFVPPSSSAHTHTYSLVPFIESSICSDVVQCCPVGSDAWNLQCVPFTSNLIICISKQFNLELADFLRLKNSISGSATDYERLLLTKLKSPQQYDSETDIYFLFVLISIISSP